MYLVVLGSGALSGLLAAPHCSLMCGPLCAYACRDAGAGAALRYQLGRIAAYGALGAAAGALGRTLVLAAGAFASGWASALLSWSLAVALAVAATRALRGRSATGGAPATIGRGPRRPSRWARLAARLPRAPWLLGALSALLPCGALYAAVAIAAASGSAAAGASFMVAFAAAGAVAVGALGAAGAALARARARWASRAAAGLLLAGAAVLVYRPIPALLTDADAPACHRARDLP